MKLYVIRHSVREEPKDFSHAEDGDLEAELTDEGIELAAAMGQWMADNDEIPNVLITSPAVRTLQTAEEIVRSITEAGYIAPDIQTDVTIGPKMSIRGLVQRLAVDKSQKRIAIVSHHESIENGLKALLVDNGDEPHVDMPAAAEMRVLKVDRDSGAWKEKQRVRPSDLGLADHY